MNTLLAPRTDFLHEADTHALLAKVGWVPPRHGWLGDALPFQAGEPVVLKGLAEGLWHKSELGALRFLPYDTGALQAAAEVMRGKVEGEGYPWIGALVCERVAIARSEGLPTEAFVSLTKGDGGWTLILGLGGLQAEAMGEAIPPLRWPIPWVDPIQAFKELEAHLLGRIWLGRLRGTQALTSEAQLRAFLKRLWALATLSEAEGLDLLELNPVVLDAQGEPRPLDGVGRRAVAKDALLPPPPDFLEALLEPRRIAVAGVSSKPDGVGRIILENLRAAGLPEGDLLIVKPGESRFLELPCLPDVTALARNPVDLLLLALPALAAVETLEALVAQGGGARVVGLVAGGIGDGADHDGLAERVRRMLQEAREENAWTPTVLGPNFLGHIVPGRALNSSFIPADKWAPPTTPGPLALVSQSGAFMLSRLNRAPHLPLALGLALGNQLDLSLSQVLEALEPHPEVRAIAAYVEGFGPGELAATARAAAWLKASNQPLLLYRAGRTEAGQAAAASHTGALAGDQVLEEALLRRAGVKIAPTISAFDAGMTWLGTYPQLRPGPVAVMSNAGFESVSAADRMGGAFPCATLQPAQVERLQALIQRSGLAGLVSARLPLDLTPMADDAAYVAAAKLLLDTEATVLVVGLIPFTRRLAFQDPEAFARSLALEAASHGKALALALDAGPAYEPLRAAFARSGVPVFSRVEEALEGLQALA
ncbi:MAG TPA: CoA-binding protein [Holophagaceae bacterium]|nr:CoA-binding protein [Holophagaceae bacterium]